MQGKKLTTLRNLQVTGFMYLLWKEEFRWQIINWEKETQWVFMNLITYLIKANAAAELLLIEVPMTLEKN